MPKFTFVDDDGNLGDWSVSVEAPTEREARKIAWASMSDEQRDACGCLDCIDVKTD